MNIKEFFLFYAPLRNNFPTDKNIIGAYDVKVNTIFLEKVYDFFINLHKKYGLWFCVYSIFWKKSELGIDRRGKSMHNGKTINACSGDMILIFTHGLLTRFRVVGNVSRIGK